MSTYEDETSMLKETRQ